MHAQRKLSNGASRTVRRLAGLGSCERGSVAPLVGVAMIMLVAAVGVAIDIGRGQVAQSKLQSSLDAAGLAAGAVVGQTLSEDELEPEAEKYLTSNFAGETIDASITGFDLQLSDDETLVTLQATATLPTTFMRVFGQKKIDVAARSEITREMTGLEVALVLDVTGSMTQAVSPSDSTPKIDVLKVAAKDLMDTLFGSNETVEDLWVGIVPFSHVVNVGTSHSDWLSDYDNRIAEDNCVGPNNHSNWNHTHSASETVPDYCPTNGPNVSTRTKPHTLVNDWMFSSKPGWYFAPHAWAGCVLERYDTDDDVTDTPPSEEGFLTFFNPDTSSSGSNNWRGNTGNYLVDEDSDVWANRNCLMSPITPMTNMKTPLKTAIGNLTAKGNTLLPLGAVWGWRLLSPKWRNEWGGAMDANGLPLDYHTPLMNKVLIFMTDGFNQMPGSSIMTGYGFVTEGNVDGATTASAADPILNSKTTEVCNAVKAQGILVYTIVFGSGGNQTSKDLMKACASEEDYYFYAESAAALGDTFDAIGDSLSKLRVSR